MKDTHIYIVVGLVLIFIIFQQCREKYYPGQTDYKYGFVDTNPQRRTSMFFDTCSPENMEDCKRNNPYEGLPLP